MRRIPYRCTYTYVLVQLVIIGLIPFFLTSCWHPPLFPDANVDQGGYDGVVIDLPFAAGYQSLCTQGAHGTTSHSGESTEYDLDFDTPNGEADLVYAPVGGVAYVHTESASRNFGYHVNIDLGDGNYVVLAHLADVFVSDGSEVASGQIVGYEGCTGSCSGDHVHVGLHEGDASLMAEYGESTEVGYWVDDVTSAEGAVAIASEEFDCGVLGEGHRYESQLPVTNWHPNGTLVLTPDDNNVYLIEDGKRRWIQTEEDFWALGYDFNEVVIVSPEELSCYDVGALIDETSDVSFAVDTPYFRDGDLVKEVSRSDVYVIADGMAMPVETWEVYLRLGFGSRSIITVDDGTIASEGLTLGSCSSGFGCIDATVIESCGGSVDGTGGVEEEEEESEEETDEPEESTEEEESGVEESEESTEEEESEEEESGVEESEESTDDSTVEVCYLPGLTMAEGELYLDGDAFTYWGSPVADTAVSGDTTLCAEVEAESGEELKLNAWYSTSAGGDVYWAAYNNGCESIDLRGTVEVDGASVIVVTSPWSDEVWETDPCSIGGDAYFEVP